MLASTSRGQEIGSLDPQFQNLGAGSLVQDLSYRPNEMPPPRVPGGTYPRGGLHGQIVHTIGRQIVNGDIGPGELLPVETGLRASRTVLREVIKVLAAKGLVESRPRTGTRVRPRKAWNLLDPDVLAWHQGGANSRAFLGQLSEVRLIVEPAAAELAARRADESELQAIDEAYRDMEAALHGSTEDYEAFDQADMRFHQAIVGACGNDLLRQMGQSVFSALLVSFQATSRLPGRAKASLPQHRVILEAVREGQAWRARAAMRLLVQTSAREIENLPEHGHS
jgi:GntR family galactonate operon transcriptional repressor